MKTLPWLVTVCFLLLTPLLPGRTHAAEVVIYTSVDQIYSEPVMKDFEQLC